MTDQTDRIADWLTNFGVELEDIESYSQEELDEEILRVRTQLRELEQQLEVVSDKYESHLEEAADNSGVQRKRALLEAKTYKDRVQVIRVQHLHLREKLARLHRIQIIRDLVQSTSGNVDIEEELAKLETGEWEKRRKKFDISDAISSADAFDAVPLALYLAGPKSAQFTKSLGVLGQIEPSDDDKEFVDADFEDVEDQAEEPSPVHRSPDSDQGSLGEQLQATPHTLYQLPKNNVDAHFYYFTDETYVNGGSKFNSLDDCLTTLGRHRAGLDVVIIDRDRIAPTAWDAVTTGLGLDDHPALVVSESALGIREVGHATTEFTPEETNFAILENGMITDQILQEEDKVRDFLNDLYDAAREDAVQSAMKKEKIIQSLTLGKDEIQSILSVQA